MPIAAITAFRMALVSQDLAPRRKVSGIDQLGRAQLLDGYPSADPLVARRGLFNQVAGEPQVQKHRHRDPVAPLEHPHDDAARIYGIHHFPKRFQAAQDLAAGHLAPHIMDVVQVAGYLDALLRMDLHVVGDIGQERAAPDQQQPVAPHHVHRECAEEQAPQKQRDQHQRAAQQHHPQGHSQRVIHVADQPLNQQGRARCQAELLHQEDARFDVDIRVQVLQVKRQQNAGQDEQNAYHPAVVQQVRSGIHLQHHIGGKYIGSNNQEGL